MLAGEPFLLSKYVNRSDQTAFIGISSNTLAKIIPIDLKQFAGEFITISNSYLCNVGDVTVSAIAQRGLIALFGGDGFILQRLKGDGIVCIQGSGTVVRKTLAIGESLCVDPGTVLGLSSSIVFDVAPVGGPLQARGLGFRV